MNKARVFFSTDLRSQITCDQEAPVSWLCSWSSSQARVMGGGGLPLLIFHWSIITVQENKSSKLTMGYKPIRRKFSSELCFSLEVPSLIIPLGEYM